MEESLASVIDEVRQRLEPLESSLPKRVDATAVSQTSKLPFKVLFYREALIWRMVELGWVGFENFERDKFVSAIVQKMVKRRIAACEGKPSAELEIAIADADLLSLPQISGFCIGRYY